MSSRNRKPDPQKPETPSPAPRIGQNEWVCENWHTWPSAVKPEVCPYCGSTNVGVWDELGG